MKLCFYMRNFTGGAPLSMLNYALVLQDAGHEVTMVAEQIGLETAALYELAGVRVVYHPIASRNPLTLYRLARHMYDAAGEADMLLPLATYSNHFLAYKAAHLLGKGYLGIVAGGRFEPPAALLRAMEEAVLICFSHENIDSAVRLGVRRENLCLISNRITAAPDPAWRSHFAFSPGKPLRLLMISRLIPDKERSVRHVMRCCAALHEGGLPVRLRVGGDGPSLEGLRLEAAEINRRLGQDIIEMLGLVTAVKQEILDAHLVFGKGRSVLEPIMMNRLGVVVGEAEDMCLCLPDTFDNLYAYNFAGREMNRQTSVAQLAGILSLVVENRYDFTLAQEAAELARTRYDVAYLPGQLLEVVGREGKKIRPKPPRPLAHSLALVFDVLYYMVASSIKKLKG